MWLTRLTQVSLLAVLTSACTSGAVEQSTGAATTTTSGWATRSLDVSATEGDTGPTVAPPNSGPTTTAEADFWTSRAETPKWQIFEPGFEPSHGVHVTGNGDRIVIIDAAGADGSTRVAVSDDGLAWSISTLPPAPTGKPLAHITTVDIREEIIHVTGSPASSNGGPAVRATWSTDDSATWTVGPSELPVEGSKSDFAVGTDGSVAWGHGHFAPGELWTRATTGEWTSLPIEEAAWKFDGGVVDALTMGVEVRVLINDGALGAYEMKTDADGRWSRHEVGPPGIWVSSFAVHGDGRQVAAGQQGAGEPTAWVSDGETWMTAADSADLAADDWGSFAWPRQVVGHDGIIVAGGHIDVRGGVEWCFVDAQRCRLRRAAVLASEDGSDWRELALPGADGPSRQMAMEPTVLRVDTRIVAVYPAGGEVRVATLDEVTGATSFWNEESPGLHFEVAESGDALEPGRTYGLAFSSHCGLEVLGTFNERHWGLIEQVFPPEDLFTLGWNFSEVYGFIELAEDGTIEFTFNNEVIARYAPGDHQPTRVC